MEYIFKFIDWLKNLDFTAIIYGIVASALFASLIKWFGFFKIVKNKIKNYFAYKKYRIKLKEDCSNLIVVGKKTGFSISEVYIDLDLAKSDLNPKNKNNWMSVGSYVLVGGPGAGKSTTVKKIILDHLEQKTTLPFFVRLREYYGFNNIEEYLLQRLSDAGFNEPEEILKKELSRNTLCVLDGLDEIRPNLKEKIYADINHFHAKYFLNESRFSKLIVSCRKEAYRNIPLNISEILEVRPLTDEQIQRFAEKWPVEYPKQKSKDTFWRDLGAAEKILQLARSPLLLVGGLMQYTESNQGIPEERFEYLQRVAKWLVVDWATAQGFPPDPNRPVYDRILTKLAFYMHSNQYSELEINECKKILSEWLPTFGLEKNEAANILESISTKTGILVREGGHNIVFAQFGMQEYFTSLELIDSVGYEKIPELKPTNWWREPILLAAAQQREPSPLLKILIDKIPLLGVAAIAECPTPSISFQSEAISICIKEIDKLNNEVESAIVNLMRKVKGDLETNLLSQLEDRLKFQNKKELKSLVGLALAKAGTPNATELLAKYPDVWDTCLTEVGYLSTSFENLLVEWIEKGTAAQSNKAIDMITGRLSVDRTLQLLKLLPSLKKDLADYLANKIISNLLNNEARIQHFGLNTTSYTVISECTPYINNGKQIEQLFKNQKFIHPEIDANFQLILKSIELYKKHNLKNSLQIFKSICNASNWSSKRSQLTLLLCSTSSTILFTANYQNDIIYLGVLSTLIALYLLSISSPYTLPPWFSKMFFIEPSTKNIFLYSTVMLTGILIAYTVGFRIENLSIIDKINPFYFLLPILFCITSYLINSKRRFFEINLPNKKLDMLINAGFLFIALLLLTIATNFLIENTKYLEILLMLYSSIYLIALTLALIILFIDYNKFKN